MLNGTVKSISEDVADVYIINKTTKKATITSAEGAFRIEVTLNDTLQFSALTYQKKEIVVNTVILNSKAITVTLDSFVNELDEVTIMPYNLSGNLGSDAGGLNIGQVVTAGTLGLPNANAKTYTQSERLLKEAASVSVTGTTSGLGAGGAVSLNPIINAITGRTKMLKKRVAIDKQYARTLRVQGMYVDSTFVKELKIPEDRINDFMYFCEVDENFNAIADGGDALRLWSFLRRKSKIYRVNNSLD